MSENGTLEFCSLLHMRKISFFGVFLKYLRSYFAIFELWGIEVYGLCVLWNVCFGLFYVGVEVYGAVLSVLVALELVGGSSMAVLVLAPHTHAIPGVL